MEAERFGGPLSSGTVVHDDGIQRQFVPGYNQKEGLRYMAVNQYIAGVNFSPTPQSDFKLEGFYKQYSRLPVSLLDSLPVSTGRFCRLYRRGCPGQIGRQGNALTAGIFLSQPEPV